MYQFVLISSLASALFAMVLGSLRKALCMFCRDLAALSFALLFIATGGYASPDGVPGPRDRINPVVALSPPSLGLVSRPSRSEFYADDCRLPNDGEHDDAAPLRICMAAMPPDATMNLDGAKPYYFASDVTSDPDGYYNGNACEIFLRGNQTLKLNGAVITPSPTEQAIPGLGVICAGSGNFGSNTPGANLGNSGPIGNMLSIGSTTGGATSLTVTGLISGSGTFCSGAACAGQIHVGDYLYVDCGCNANVGDGCTGGDQDIFIGWAKAAAAGNTSTGIVPLEYPLLKPYNPSETPDCSSATAGTARIFDWSTCGADPSACGVYEGPLVQNVYIEGPGTINAGTAEAMFYMGVVGGRVTGLTVNLSSPQSEGQGFFFGNNNHLVEIDHNIIKTPGCTGDTNVSAGEFTSSMNTISHNSVVVTGVGCSSSQGEKVFGDSEGDESNHYSYNTTTIEAGGSANPGLSSCDYAFNTWGDTFDHENCTSAYTGFLDGPAGNRGEAGPTVVTNGNYSAANNGLTMQVPGDQVIGNTITEAGGGIAIYLLGEAQISNNVIHLTTVSTEFGALAIQAGISGNSVYNSQIGYNVFDCMVPGGCPNGMYIEDPGVLLPSATLTIAEQAFSGFSDDFDLLGDEEDNVPNQQIQGFSE